VADSLELVRQEEREVREPVLQLIAHQALGLLSVATQEALQISEPLAHRVRRQAQGGRVVRFEQTLPQQLTRWLAVSALHLQTGLQK
jgi:hypothetical protein